MHSVFLSTHDAHSGYQPRFSQTLVIYEGGGLPKYEGQDRWNGADQSNVRRADCSETLPHSARKIAMPSCYRVAAGSGLWIRELGQMEQSTSRIGLIFA
jgi:hypothetical protein